VHFVDSVHKNIFAVHGGIPIKLEEPTKTLAFRRLSFRSFKETFEEMDSISQQFLSNNPGVKMAKGIQFQQIENSCGYEFGKHIFSDFTRKNKVDFFVRSNQPVPEGYEFLWKNKLLTLFSASDYDGKPYPAKICEVIFPPDPEYSDEEETSDEEDLEDEDVDGEGLDENSEKEESDEDELDEEKDEEELEDTSGQEDESDQEKAEQDLDNIKEVIIRIVDLEKLQS
jgi:hypothetical protein